jgi:hypothetical protein
MFHLVNHGRLEEPVQNETDRLCQQKGNRQTEDQTQQDR